MAMGEQDLRRAAWPAEQGRRWGARKQQGARQGKEGKEAVQGWRRKTPWEGPWLFYRVGKKFGVRPQCDLVS